MPNVTNVALRNGNGTADIKCLMRLGSQSLCGSESIPQNAELRRESGCAGREVPAEEVPSATTLPCRSPPHCYSKGQLGLQGRPPARGVWKASRAIERYEQMRDPKEKGNEGGLESCCCYICI